MDRQDMGDKELYRLAKQAAGNAYAPYSGFKVGAALLCADGSVYTGINIENASYPAGLCAERNAMSAAITAGKRDFIKIAVCAKNGKAWPCGICRQFMMEFSPEILVMTGDDEENIEKAMLKDLLPNSFSFTDDVRRDDR